MRFDQNVEELPITARCLMKTNKKGQKSWKF